MTQCYKAHLDFRDIKMWLSSFKIIKTISLIYYCTLKYAEVFSSWLTLKYNFNYYTSIWTSQSAFSAYSFSVPPSFFQNFSNQLLVGRILRIQHVTWISSCSKLFEHFVRYKNPWLTFSFLACIVCFVIIS